MKNKKTLAIVSLVLSIIGFILSEFIMLKPKSTEIIYLIVMSVICIIGIVFGYMGKTNEKGKGIATAGRIIGYIGLILAVLSAISFAFIYPKYENCKVEENGTATCVYAGSEIPSVIVDYLDEDQFAE